MMASLWLVLGLVACIYLTNGSLFESKKCYDNLGCFTNEFPFTNALGEVPSSPSDVAATLNLYTNLNPSQSQLLNYDDIESIKKTNFNPKLKTKILVHGYMSNRHVDFMIQMRQLFLKLEPMNMIVVDWSKGAHTFYPKAVANTRLVGAIIAKFVETVIENYDADASMFHVLGHSLGAHIAGYVGMRTHNLGRISGLDPAGPLFENTDEEVRLDPSDATFVDCTHSDGLPLYDLGLGTSHAWGDIDFYPNGAGNQPGCPKPIAGGLHAIFSMKFSELTTDVSCSHHRAVSYYQETLLQNETCQFKAYPCKSYTDFQKGLCTSCGDGPCPVMGYHSIDSHRKGKCYLNTNSHQPFCKSS